MGDRVIDWFLPIRYSPICSHDGRESAYPLGPVVEKLRQEFGLASDRPRASPDRNTRSRSRTGSDARKHRHSEKGQD